MKYLIESGTVFDGSRVYGPGDQLELTADRYRCLSRSLLLSLSPVAVAPAVSLPSVPPSIPVLLKNASHAPEVSTAGADLSDVEKPKPKKGRGRPKKK